MPRLAWSLLFRTSQSEFRNCVAAFTGRARVLARRGGRGRPPSLQECKDRLLIGDARQAWEVVKPYLTEEGYRRCLTASQSEIRSALRQTGMKASDVTAMRER